MKHPQFAKKFKQAVSMAGVKDTQKSLSQLLGVSEVMIWSYKNGEKLPRMSTALRIASELGVSVDWLLQDAPMVADEAPVYRKEIKRKSIESIIDFAESLSESERKDALQILKIAFKKD
ncbi:MAG: helix-turn-helix transcriptional regulator [Cellvibrionaceae bacterium]|nr:helix-turn-helix transcriptional regulator [Cellvibrionaceae bacterium]